MSFVESWLDKRSVSVKERVRRLNPNPKQGELIRGYYVKPLSWRRVKKKLIQELDLPLKPLRMPDGRVLHIWQSRVTKDDAVRNGWIKGVPNG